MGTVERREREKESRKQAIIAAAEEVIFSKGYDHATMDDIAEKAELSKGTLYLYFKSKEEVYIAIILRAMQIMGRLFEEAVTGQPNGLLKVRAIGEAYMKFHREYPNYYQAMMYFSKMQIDADSPAGAELKAFHKNKDVMDLFIDSIKEGINDGSLRSDLSPEHTAIILWGATSGLLQLITLKGNALDHHFNVLPEDVINYFMSFILRGLKT
ncbi:MAG: TetR/AcrR family transcriptional regulator [bacterium]